MDDDDVKALLIFGSVLLGLKLFSDKQNEGKPTELIEAERCFNQGLYKSSILMSLVALENALKKKYQMISGKPMKKEDLSEIINGLHKKGVVNKEQYHKLEYFRNLRNSLVHSERQIIRNEADSILKMVSSVLLQKK